MKTEDTLLELLEQIAQLRASLYDAKFALMSCKNQAKAFKKNALPTSKTGFEEIEKIAEKAEKDID